MAYLPTQPKPKGHIMDYLAFNSSHRSDSADAENTGTCTACEAAPINPLGSRPLCGDCADAMDDFAAMSRDGWGDNGYDPYWD